MPEFAQRQTPTSGVRGGGVGRAAATPGWKIENSGQTLFSGQVQVAQKS